MQLCHKVGLNPGTVISQGSTGCDVIGLSQCTISVVAPLGYSYSIVAWCDWPHMSG